MQGFENGDTLSNGKLILFLKEEVSIHSEAIDQLLCLLERSYPHREYLAHCWVTFLFRQLAAAVEGAEDHQHRTILPTLVRKSCPTLVASDQQSPGSRRSI
jgi:hypothetical protein